MDKERRVFIAMYNFPPIGIGRGIAWHYFATALHKQGYRVTVITVEPALNDPYYNMDKLKLIDEHNYKIIRLKDSKLYYRIYNKKRINSSETSKNTGKNSFKKLIIKIYRTVSRVIFYPDRMVIWSKKVKRFLENTGVNDKDLVISVGFPFSTHIQMEKLKRKTGCKLIFDYGDPWSFNPSVDTEPNWRKKYDYIKEKNILKNVDYLTVTTEKTCEIFKNIFNINNVCVISQGVNNKDYILDVKTRNTTNIIKLTYTGIFYKEIRDPSLFFENLRKIDTKIQYKIELTIAGRIDAYFSQVFANLELHNMKNIKVIFLGNIGFNECVKLQNEADVLLFFSNKEGIQVPGKIYEYLATDKPIISISYEEGETEKIIKKHKRGIIIQNDNAMQKKLIDALNIYNEKRCLPGVENRRVDDYDWNNISKKIVDIIGKVF